MGPICEDTHDPNLLAELLISSSVLPSIKPIDRDLILESCSKTKNVFTCEEHSIIGGLGSAVLETLEETRGIFLKKIGIGDCFGESGLPEELFEKYGLSAHKIVETIECWKSKKRPAKRRAVRYCRRLYLFRTGFRF